MANGVDAVLNKLDMLWTAGQYHVARDEAQRLIAAYPENMIVRERLAQFEWALGQYEAALLQFDALLRVAPRHGGALIGRAAILRRMGRISDARNALYAADAVGVRHTLLLAEWIAVGEVDTLTAADLGVIKRQIHDGLTPEMAFDVARLLRLHGEFSSAAELLIRVCAHHPRNSLLGMELSRIHQDAGEPEAALALLNTLIPLTTDEGILARLWFEIGQSNRIARRFELARSTYEKALGLDPALEMARTNIAAIEIEEGRLGQADRLLSEVVARSPDIVEAWFMLTQTRVLARKIGPWFDAMDRVERLCAGKSHRLALWNRVNRAAGLYLANHVNEAFAALNNSQSILQREDGSSRHYKIYWLYIRRLIQWRAENQHLFGVGAEHGLLHVIGESHALSPNFGLVNWVDDRRLRCVAHWVPGCKQWHLANHQPNRYKSAVASVIAQIPTGADLMFCIGEIDTRPDEGIWSAARNSGNATADLVRQTAEGYLQFIADTVVSEREYRSITIQGIPAPGYPLEGNRGPGDTAGFLAMIRDLNLHLQSGAQARGWYFLDVYAATVDENGKGNAQWHLDAYHLQPGFYLAAEKWLRRPLAQRKE